MAASSKPKPPAKTDEAQDRKLVTRGVHQHEANMHRGKSKTALRLGTRKK